MIAIVGSPVLAATIAQPEGIAAGRAARIAVAAAAAGARVEIVGRVGEDAAGDRVLLELARAGVGHLAVLRDTHPTPVMAAPAPSAGDEEDPAAALLAEDESGTPPVPGLALDAADIALGLRYIGEFRVAVAAEPVDEAAAQAIADAAAFMDAALVAVLAAGDPVPAALAAATVIEAPDDDPDDDFAGLVGRFAAALDEGAHPAAAFRAATTAGGWQPAVEA